MKTRSTSDCTLSGAKHVLFVPGALWGHLRPALATICSLLSVHPNLYVTLFLPTPFSTITDTELSYHKLNRGCRDRLQILRYGEEGDYLASFQEIPKRMAEAVENIRKNMPKLINYEGIEDAVSGKVTTTFRIRISTIFSDYLWNTDLPQVLIEINPHIKRVCFIPMATQMLDWWNMDLTDQPAVKDLMKDMDLGVTAHEAWVRRIQNNDEIVQVPGCEKMYVYETGGIQGNTLEPWMAPYRNGRTNLQRGTHGILAYFPPFLARASLKNWSLPNIPLYCVGPLLPSFAALKGSEDETSGWLEDMLAKYGARSVAYVSFGSLFFPPTASQVPILISALAKRDRPTLFVVANCTRDIERILEKSSVERGRGLIKLVKWVTQQAVLNHPAIGWFLTHAGQGASMETISAGLPMVIWPAFGDQVFLANQFSRKELIGIELLQIRGEVAIGKKTYRGTLVLGTDVALAEELDDALQRIDGDEGQQMRLQVQKIREEIEKDLEEDGKTWRALREVAMLWG